MSIFNLIWHRKKFEISELTTIIKVDICYSILYNLNANFICISFDLQEIKKNKKYLLNLKLELDQKTEKEDYYIEEFMFKLIDINIVSFELDEKIEFIVESSVVIASTANPLTNIVYLR